MDISKIPTGSAGFSTDMVGPTSLQPKVNDIGAFRTVCVMSHMSFDDPIVYPGQPGKSHLHVFFGNTGTNANTTVATLQNSGNSTCRGGTINRSGYWVPAMIDTSNNAPIAPAAVDVYYKTGYNGVVPATVHALPQGLRMIAGDPKGSGPVQYGPARFTCLDTSTGNGTPWGPGLPADCAAGKQIWAAIVFPQCWDGVNLDSPDHRSHMAYPQGGCPATHPVALPEVSFNVVYNVTASTNLAKWRLSSDVYDKSLPAGYSMHGDWFNGWKPDITATWIKNCSQASLDCASGLLGDGRMLLGLGN